MLRDTNAVFCAVFLFASGITFGQSPATNFDASRIDTLIRQLGSERFRDRESAVAALVAIGMPALPKVQAAMRSRDPEVAPRRAVECAAVIARRGRIAELIEMLQNKDPALRVKAIDELAPFAGEGTRAIPTLIRLLDDPSVHVRTGAAAILAALP